MGAPPHEPTVADELRALLVLSWPIILAQLLTMTLGLVETAVVGRVSTTELAGVAVGRAVAFAASMVAIGVAMGLEPLASQAVGAGEPERAWGGLVTTVRAVALLSPPLVVAGLGLSMLLEAIGVDHAIAWRARAYEIGAAPGLALIVVFYAGKTFLQAHGRTKPALVAAVVANGVNVCVCNLFVRGDEALVAVGFRPRGWRGFGAFGAGIAVSLTCAVLAAIVLGAAWRLRPAAASPRVPLRLSLRLGLPIGFQSLAEVGVFTVGAVLVGRFGPVAVSAHQIAIGLASFTYMGALGVSAATSVRVGYAVGQSRSPRRAGLLGLGVGIAFMSMGALAFGLFPDSLVRLFTEDGEAVRLGKSLLFIAALFQLFDGVQVVAAGALRGMGDVRFPFFANVGAHWAIGFPSACVLGFALGFGVRGIWWGLTAGLVCIAALLSARFLRLSKRAITRV